MFKKIKVFVLVLFIKTIGRLSTGINVCFEYGLTAGRMLDYIYENKASGKFIIGRLIDRIYLNHPDWQAIRERKDNVKNYIKEVIKSNREKNISTIILDIAAGYARYILEALKECGNKNAKVMCLDTNPDYAVKVKEIFHNEGFIIGYENKSALDKDFLFSLSPNNLIISSGFYDWIVEDNFVKDSIKLVYDILSEGGYFILTGQAKHPDLELVSRGFTDFKKEPLRMKMRPIETMTGWLEQAGFKNIESKIDKWGYFYTIYSRRA